MSVERTLATVENDVKGFFAKVKNDVVKARQFWTMISSTQTRAFLVKLGSEFLKFAKDGAAAVDGKGVNFEADAELYADAKQLLADAKAGEGVIVADLKILGIGL